MPPYVEDPYLALGVPYDVDLKEVKKTYRRLALQFHPDKCMDATPEERDAATKRFASVAHAYEILSDEVLKSVYDRDNNIDAKRAAGVSPSAAAASTTSPATRKSSPTSNNSKNATASAAPVPTTTVSTATNDNVSGGRAKNQKKKGSGGTTDNGPKPFEYKFSDPYDIWKRDFKDQFGYEYPGAAYDFVDYDTPVIAPDTATAEANKRALLEKSGVNPDDDYEAKKDFGTTSKNKNGKKKKKGLSRFNPFGGRKSKDDSSNNDDGDGQLVVHDGKKGTEVAKYDGKNKSQLAVRENNDANSDIHKVDNSQALVVSQGRNNRPIAMDVVTKTDEKTGVTTTITTITRPDGTTESMVMKTGLPKKKDNKKKPPALAITNGEQPPPKLAQLTNGDEPKKQITNGSGEKPKKKKQINGNADDKENKNQLMISNGDDTNTLAKSGGITKKKKNKQLTIKSDASI